MTGGEDDPARQAQLADSLSMAVLMLLERLSPEQRAVLLLRDVFDYSYQEIAGVVGKTEKTRASSQAGHASRSKRDGRASRPPAHSRRS